MNNETFQHLQEMLDIFTKENYPPNENNISQVPFDDVFNQLMVMFPQGFDYEVTHCGEKSDGTNYVAVKLTLPLQSGPVTRPGAAEGNIGFSGLIGVALKNAVLRHFGMGQGLYQYEEGAEPKFPSGNSGKQSRPIPSATMPSVATPSAGQTYGNPNAINTQANRSFRAWDGKLRIKSGPYQGKAWEVVDMNDLQDMVNMGNIFATKEMKRRQESGKYPASPF